MTKTYEKKKHQKIIKKTSHDNLNHQHIFGKTSPSQGKKKGKKNVQKGERSTP